MKTGQSPLTRRRAKIAQHKSSAPKKTPEDNLNDFKEYLQHQKGEKGIEISLTPMKPSKMLQILEKHLGPQKSVIIDFDKKCTQKQITVFLEHVRNKVQPEEVHFKCSLQKDSVIKEINDFLLHNYDIKKLVLERAPEDCGDEYLKLTKAIYTQMRPQPKYGELYEIKVWLEDLSEYITFPEFDFFDFLPSKDQVKQMHNVASDLPDVELEKFFIAGSKHGYKYYKCFEGARYLKDLPQVDHNHVEISAIDIIKLQELANSEHPALRQLTSLLKELPYINNENRLKEICFIEQDIRPGLDEEIQELDCKCVIIDNKSAASSSLSSGSSSAASSLLESEINTQNSDEEDIEYSREEEKEVDESFLLFPMDDLDISDDHTQGPDRIEGSNEEDSTHNSKEEKEVVDESFLLFPMDDVDISDDHTQGLVEDEVDTLGEGLIVY